MPNHLTPDTDFPQRSRWLAILLWPWLFGWAVVFVILAAFGFELALAAAVGCLAGLALVLVVLLTTTKLIEGQLGAVSADPDKHALLFNTVEALCLVNGLPAPKLTVMEEASPTALAYGIRISQARICVSAGFFERLSVVEQEAVVAHALCRIHRGDFRGDSLSAVVFGLVLTPLGLRKLAGRSASAIRGSNALLAADLAAVRLTRYPPALVSSLETIQDQTAPKLPSYLDHLQTLPRQGQVGAVEYRVSVLVEI